MLPDVFVCVCVCQCLFEIVDADAAAGCRLFVAMCTLEIGCWCGWRVLLSDVDGCAGGAAGCR